MTAGEGTAVLAPVHQKVHFANPVHVLQTFWGRPRVWTSPGESFGRSILNHIAFADNRTWWTLSSMSGSLTWLLWNEVDFFQDPLSPLALKQQRTITFHYGWLLNCGKLHGSTSGAPALNQLVTLVRRPGWCRTTTFFMEQLGTLSTCGNCYVIVKRYWAFRGLYFSESVVFHLDSWVSFSVVFCLGCVWGGFVALEDTWLFAFHLFSYNVRIADRPQDVLMTVRASSVHGMS